SENQPGDQLVPRWWPGRLWVRGGRGTFQRAYSDDHPERCRRVRHLRPLGLSGDLPPTTLRAAAAEWEYTRLQHDYPATCRAGSAGPSRLEVQDSRQHGAVESAAPVDKSCDAATRVFEGSADRPVGAQSALPSKTRVAASD